MCASQKEGRLAQKAKVGGSYVDCGRLVQSTAEEAKAEAEEEEEAEEMEMEAEEEAAEQQVMWESSGGMQLRRAEQRASIPMTTLLRESDDDECSDDEPLCEEPARDSLGSRGDVPGAGAPTWRVTTPGAASHGTTSRLQSGGTWACDSAASSAGVASDPPGAAASSAAPSSSPTQPRATRGSARNAGPRTCTWRSAADAQTESGTQSRRRRTASSISGLAFRSGRAVTRAKR